MFRIPFEWLPGAWGLKGKTRAIAKAEYELSGIDLDKKLLDIDMPEDSVEKTLRSIDINFKYKLIDEFEKDRSKAETSALDEQAKKMAILEVENMHGRISGAQYERRKADVLGLPWVSMPKIHWDPLSKGRTYFELDYNEHFVKHLRENGYEGAEDDDVINQWMNDICISISEEINDLEGELVTPSRRRDPRADS